MPGLPDRQLPREQREQLQVSRYHHYDQDNDDDCYRVSFHSVKDSSSAGPQTGASSDHEAGDGRPDDPGDPETDREDRGELTVSSSLPPPPPPPLQEHISCL